MVNGVALELRPCSEVDEGLAAGFGGDKSTT